MYWSMRAELQRIYGGKIRFPPLQELIKRIKRENNLQVSRAVLRKKSNAIDWLCENYSICKSYLEIHLDPGAVTDSDRRVQARWSEAKEIDERFTRTTGAKLSAHQLVTIARRAAAQCGLRVDRDATRSRAVTLTWFAENWNLVESHIDLNGILVESHPEVTSPVSEADYSYEWPDDALCFDEETAFLDW